MKEIEDSIYSKKDVFWFNFVLFSGIFIGCIIILVCILISPIILPIKYIVNKFKKKHECSAWTSCEGCDVENCGM